MPPNVIYHKIFPLRSVWKNIICKSSDEQERQASLFTASWVGGLSPGGVQSDIKFQADNAHCHGCSVAQLCLPLWDPVDCSPPHSSVHGISQARILEWVAISSSRGSSWARDQNCVSCDSCIGRHFLTDSNETRAWPWKNSGRWYLPKMLVNVKQLIRRILVNDHWNKWWH